MDNTELHYLTYDPESIWIELLTNYVDAGGDLLYPGDEKEMLLRSVQADIVQVFASVDNALRMQTLRYAVGTYLDILGELRGCPRIEASQAKATVNIITNKAESEMILAEGSLLTADGQIYYALATDVVLPKEAGSVTAEVVAEIPGTIGNGLVTGTQMTLFNQSSAVTNIVVTEDAKGGNDRETDDVYRNRIREHGFFAATAGPASQYEEMAKAVSSEILDAKAVNEGAGNVGIYLILKNDTGTSGIIDSVTKALSADDVRPLTDTVSVKTSEAVNYVLNVEYQLENSTSADFEKAISEYQEWQDSTIGRAFNPDRLIAALYNAGALRVKWGAGSVFGQDGAIEYTEIGDTQHCKGTVTLKNTING